LAFKIEITESKDKTDKYESLLPQIIALISDENDLIANLGNVCSVLKYSFENFLWVGFYLKCKDNPEELVLGPFQGRVACTRISFGKGVCGKAAESKKTVIVENVGDFPGHIVCDPLSRSEIVVPVITEGNVIAVLDIDSGEYSGFDVTDKKYLEQMIENIKYIFSGK